MKPLTQIDDNFSSSPQIDVEDLAEIKAAGFKSVICNRPDDEDGGAHADHALLEATAQTLGLKFFYLPVVPGQMTESHVSQFKAAMETLPGPVLGYCRLGMRAKTLYQRASDTA
jgi:sulfide:quinone oxidoreductase